MKQAESMVFRLWVWFPENGVTNWIQMQSPGFAKLALDRDYYRDLWFTNLEHTP